MFSFFVFSEFFMQEEQAEMIFIEGSTVWHKSRVEGLESHLIANELRVANCLTILWGWHLKV